MYKEINRKARRREWLLGLAIILAIGLLVIPISRKVSRDMTAQSEASVKEAVMRSAVQCYAVEGAYPNSLEYLEDHYGLIIDHNTYIISYEAYAENLPPTIRVLRKGSSQGSVAPAPKGVGQ